MGSGIELLGVREAAHRLGVHENTVRSYARKGLLSDLRIPGTSSYKFRASDVERLKARHGAASASLLPDRRAANPEYATASQLASWPQSNARQAQDRLPELVRRLLFETPGVSRISIRTGDGVALAGRDGTATIEAPTLFLPRGEIWFEFGTDQNSKRKATKDYNGRKSEARKDVTFVFVTVRRWQGKDAWAVERRSEQVFRDILVLDADDLEAWLQVAPAAHLWVSETLGLRPRDAQTLEGWWDRFSTATSPALPSELFIAGRATEAQRLRSLLDEAPRIASIQAEWVDDALGFLYASLAPGDSNPKGANAVTVVRSAEVWERIVTLPATGILMPDFDNADVARALASGRHVVSIVDSDSAARRSVDIRLPRVGRREAAEAFRKVDVEWRRADRLAVLARRSMPALTRHLSLAPRVHQPMWSQPPLADTLAALMLASRWANRPEDLHVLSELAAMPPVDLQRAISDAGRGFDPAIRNVRNTFVFTSLEDAFLEFRDRVSPDLAARWARIAIGVLLDPDPLEGLSSHEQVAAQMEGRRRIYSEALRRGIADSLALAGSIEPSPSGGNHAAAASERVVREVLRQVLADAERYTWSGIADVLPLIAEAAPGAFLSALEDDLATGEPTVSRMFDTVEDSLGPAGRLHHLLWALEVLCWSPEHLVRATRILAHLSQYDLPKNSGNSPLRSMSTVLCGWIRNTNADLETRLQALDACRVVNANTGWSLLRDLWPGGSAWTSPPMEPRYQLWKPQSNRMPHNEWLAFAVGLRERALEWAKTDRTALPWLVEMLSTVDPDEASRIIDFLENQSAREDLDQDVRLALFEKVRNVCVRHERFQFAEWTMPAELRARLGKLSDSLQPVDDPRRFAYLFDWRPELTDADLSDYGRYLTVLEAKRREALEALFARPDGWKQLGAVAARVEAPTQVGWALATYEPVDALDAMLEWLSSESGALQEAATTWVRRRLALKGPADLRRALEQGDVGDGPLMRFVLNIPTARRFWEVLADFPEAEDLFWSEAHFVAVPDEDVINAIEMLLERARAWSAIEVASHAIFNAQEGRRHLPRASLVLSILRAAVTQDPGAAGAPQMCSHYVGILLDYLDSADVSGADLASLEFGYYRLLEHDREPRALNRALAADPDLFVDLVQRAYWGANEPHRQSEGADPLAEHAWWVLSGWHGFPGCQDDGSLDEAAMWEWVRVARRRLSELDRGDIGDELIGQTLAYSPVDALGIWPSASVRDLIESIGSRRLEDGAIRGRLNIRGVTSRGVYDGGGQERALADQYKRWGLDVQGEWPRSARILRAIAESYGRDAVREDEEAQLGQDLD